MSRASLLRFSGHGFTFHVSRLTPLILVALIALFFNKLAFTNLILARGDPFLYFYPYWEAAARALWSGRLPLWNPWLFMGAPLLANSQVGFFYPLNWPLWLLLPVPYAVSASILVHLFIAGLGAYLAARRTLGLERAAALLAAALFALGGYLTAQVEHVNQLQGLAWLPWFWVVMGGRWQVAGGRWQVAAVAGLFALQLLAGHSQTAFITAVGLLLWLLFENGTRILADSRGSSFGEVRRSWRRFVGGRLVIALGGAMLAAGLAAVQLVPTLELAQLSSRGGGLPYNEVVSFSLHPLLLARSLLPHYGQSLFTEYVAFLPLTALLLAMLGGCLEWGRPGVVAFVALAVVALLLALGLFTPLYWLLGRAPLFDLFRAPARWLALYAFAAAMLAGVGYSVVSSQSSVVSKKGREAVTLSPRHLVTLSLLLLALMLWGVLSVPLAGLVPLGGEVAAEFPSTMTWLGWGVELLALVLLLWPGAARWRGAALPLVGLVALLLASRTLPYNHLTAPQAYFSLRPPPARLIALDRFEALVNGSIGRGCFPLRRPTPTPATANGGGSATAEPMGRFLSLSDILFDLGDQAEIEAIYGDQLPAAALYDLVVASKQKEVIASNLPLAYRLQAVDGFDGGILPLAAYGELARLLLPAGQTASDGRLREYLERLPEDRWLDLLNARYLVTDKIGDAWHEGVYFDRQHLVRLDAGDVVAVGYVPAFEATELWLLANEPSEVAITTAGGEVWRLEPEPDGEERFVARFPRPETARAIALHGPATGAVQVSGLTLVDGREGAFQSLVPGGYRLIYSGDVKIYENLDVLPRAFISYDWHWQPGIDASRAAMAEPGFDPRTMTVLAGEPGSLPSAGEGETGEVQFICYEPEQVVLRTESQKDGLLVLTDAFYPGWQATVDGAPQPIYQADVLFRGVFVPAGEHEVVFTFRPRSVTIGAVITLMSLVGWVVLVYFGAKHEMEHG